MGGGDLNMKKSWHPLLLKNQERVWLEEKKALEEKKKLDQLRKEKEEERQLQELQRLQEEQTGKKRTDKLEWMYATPAEGSGANPNDLEDYLLGKKRVDKILTADEHAKIGAAHKNFIAVQNANTARDIASKIREDPLLAIKQQEQAAYQALMNNPLRLRELQERTGIKSKKEKKDKSERKREKEERKRAKREATHSSKHHRSSRSESRSRSPRRRSRSPTPLDERGHRHHHSDSRRERSPEHHSSRSHRDRDSHHGSSHRHQSRSRDREDRDRRRGYSREGDYDAQDSRRPPLTTREDARRSASPASARQTTDRSKRPRSRSRSRSRSPPRWNGDRSEHKRTRVDRSPPPPPRDYRPPPPPRDTRPPPPPRDSRPPPPSRPDDQTAAEERAARLAAMQSNAVSMSAERKERLAILLEKEKAELAEEEKKRSRGVSSYLSAESKKVFGGVGGLEDRIKRGRGGMVVDAD